jgi:predicted  nucleic acid-binding Zn-ribbon protein
MTDQELNGRFEQIDRRFEQVDQRFEQIDRRFEQVDQRFEQIDRRFEQVDQRFDAIEKRLDDNVELMRSIETNLLREFRKWAISFESRFRANEILVGGFNERLIALEERMGDIERRSENRQ